MIEIALDSDGEWDSSGAPWAELADTSLNAAVAESDASFLASSDRTFEVSLALLEDDDVHTLNREWRGKDKPTNVLSFPMLGPEDINERDGPPALLGDIALAYGVCAREADEKNIPLVDHARHLMVHGMLHLLGYDHQDDDEAADMEARETRALARLGIANPYEEKE